jgi:hypothetical protein
LRFLSPSLTPSYARSECDSGTAVIALRARTSRRSIASRAGCLDLRSHSYPSLARSDRRKPFFNLNFSCLASNTQLRVG